MQQKGLLSHRLISGLKSKALKSVQDSFCSADEGGREKKKSKNVHQKKKSSLPAHQTGIPPDENWSVSLIYNTSAGVTVHMDLIHVSLAQHHLQQLLRTRPTQSLCGVPRVPLFSLSVSTGC